MSVCAAEFGIRKPRATDIWEVSRSTYRVNYDCTNTAFVFLRCESTNVCYAMCFQIGFRNNILVYWIFREKNGTLTSRLREGPYDHGQCPQGLSTRMDYFVVESGIQERQNRNLKLPVVRNLLSTLGSPNSKANSAELLAMGSTFHYFDLEVPTGDEKVDAVRLFLISWTLRKDPLTLTLLIINFVFFPAVPLNTCPSIQKSNRRLPAWHEIYSQSHFCAFIIEGGMAIFSLIEITC